MKTNKFVNLILALALVLTMASCTASDKGNETTKPEATTSEATTSVETTTETTAAPDSTTAEQQPETTAPEATTGSTSTEESAPSSTETAPENGTETTPNDSASEYPTYDYMSMDLTQYVTLGQYKGLSVEIPKKIVVDDEYIASVLTSDILYYGYYNEVKDRAVTKDDIISISYVGYLDGVAFENGTGSKEEFTMSDGGGFIDGFAEGLVGAMPGIEVDVNVTFPESYPMTDLAGKAVVFKVTVNYIYEAQTLTDELAKQMTAGEFTTAAALLEYYEEYLNEYAETTYLNNKSSLTWELINKNATVIKNPDEIIDSIFNYEISYYKELADAYGMDLDTMLIYAYGYDQKTLREEISQSVINNIVVYSIIKAEGLSLTEEIYNEFIESTGYTEEELLESYTKKELEEYAFAFYTYDLALEWQTYVEVDAE